MTRKSRYIVFLMVTSIVIEVFLTPVMLYAYASIPRSHAEELVKLTDRAEQQVKNLIDFVYVNATALERIVEAGLIDELDANVSLYSDGVGNLTAAHEALDLLDYESTINYVTESLRIFREIFKSIHITLEKAGLQQCHIIDNQGLLEAITRQLQRTDRLREILPANVSEEIVQLLDATTNLLDITTARVALLDGNINEVISRLQEAKGLLSQVYVYLKAQAKELNTERIYNYCQRVRERINEEFRQANQTGIDIDSILKSLGYKNENHFIETLENAFK